MSIISIYSSFFVNGLDHSGKPGEADLKTSEQVELTIAQCTFFRCPAYKSDTICRGGVRNPRPIRADELRIQILPVCVRLRDRETSSHHHGTTTTRVGGTQ